MTTHSGTLGPASSRWSDYVGTAAADDAAAVLNSPSIYELAGIDREQWTIVSIQLGADDTTNDVTVFAVDRIRHKVDTLADIEELGYTAGEIPVVAFPVPKTRIDEFIDQAFRTLTIRLVSRSLRDQTLVLEYPAQP